MRFLIQEQSYERPIASGRLQYQQDGAATGAYEDWRLTTAVSGYRFLRVDLDARQAESGHSYLYHLVLDPDDRLERLSYRFWSAARQVSGTVLPQDGTLIASRDIDGRRYEDVSDWPAQSGFWFPSAVGLGLLAQYARNEQSTAQEVIPAVTLITTVDGSWPPVAQLFALHGTEVGLAKGPEEPLAMMGETVAVSPLSIQWEGQQRTIWLDGHDWPLKMRRADGLTAVESRYVRYHG